MEPRVKRRLLDLLACPIDRTRLELQAWEERGDEVTSGLLINTSRRLAYPIHAGVPRLLVFPTGVARAFAAEHGARLAREGLTLPARASAPGEEDVLRSFSAEWAAYDWNPRAYWNLAPETWFACMKFILRLEQFPIAGKRVLEVGIGIGGVADYNARVEGAEVVGMDLGHSVDAAYRHFGSNPKLHIIQASLFAPPFAESSFDFVYSFGVIHHTFSTRTAFDRIATLPREGGRLSVWVYSPQNERRNAVRRLIMAMERVIRPVVWRLSDKAQTAALLPLVPLYMAFQRLRASANEGQVRYGWREALHAARDRFTPRFIHRHTDDEVCSWFAEAGYERLHRASESERPSWVPIAFTASTCVDGERPTPPPASAR